MKLLLTLTLMAILCLGCTINGQFYLLNSSDQKIEVILKINKHLSVNPDFSIKIDDLSKRKIRFSSNKKMKKRFIPLDTSSMDYSFSLRTGEFAHIGYGPNTRIWNAEEILILKDLDIIKVKGMEYG